MSNFKNSWLKVDFPQKIHNDLQLIDRVTKLGYCGAAVEAMRLGIKALMSQEVKEESS
tara:strand:+ start:1597 stop:1770 length:174 start_codon:yes stop_codon:yes gene_type:complete